ncbi:MAG: outer membrane beta-barrel protein [Verrucomicrobiae bacterium]|nr:outer membrane beta-barrel protein [Verrucomicrobiae bacterium]
MKHTLWGIEGGEAAMEAARRRQIDGRIRRERGVGGVGTAGWLLAMMAGGSAWADFDSERYLIYELGSVTLRPHLGIGQVYDSNIFYNDENRVDDFITTVQPSLGAFYGDREASFASLRYTLDASFYAERDDLNNLGHSLVHQSRFQFSRTSIEGQDRFSITKNLLGGSFSYIQRRIGVVSLRDDWRADYSLSPKTSLGARVSFDMVDYDAKDLAPNHLYDFMSYSGGFRVGYLPSEKIVVYPEISAGQSLRETNSPLVREAPDLTFYGISVGAEGEFTPKLTGTVSGGYEFRDYEDDTEVPNGWIASVQLRWQARPKTVVSVGYRHWIEVSREVVGSSYNVHRPSVAVTQQLGTQDRWTLGVEGFYQLDDYDETSRFSGVARKDTLGGASARASYRWQPWLVASAGYDFRIYDGNVPTIPTYEVHRVSLRLAAGY